MVSHPYFMSHSAPYAGSPGNGQHGGVGDLPWRLPPPETSVGVDHLVTFLRHQPVADAMKDPQTTWIMDQLVLFLKHTSISAAVDDPHALPFITGHNWSDVDPDPPIRTRMPNPFLY